MCSHFLRAHQAVSAVAQRILARKIAGYSFAILAASLLVGTMILNFFGVSLPVIQIAGGMVVAATGWNLLNQSDQDSSVSNAAGTLEDALVLCKP